MDRVVMIRKDEKIVVNFVMSNDVYSGIFDALVGFYKKYLPEDINLYVTKYPIARADVYHYHRPNLESNLKENSVVTVHHDLDDTDPWFDSSMFIDRYHEANKILCLNSKQVAYLKINENFNNTVLIPHGVNPEIFNYRPKVFNESRKFRIGVVSKRYARRVKGEAYLHEIYKRLDPNIIEFIFVGEGRSIDKLYSESLGFSSTAYESLPYEMFDELYKEMDVLLVPSLFEGGPANIPEAIYCGVPILGRNIAMIKDYLENGKNGYFLTGDFDVDSSLISDLACDNNGVFTSVIENIKNSERPCFTWEKVVNKHAEVYRDVVAFRAKDQKMYEL